MRFWVASAMVIAGVGCGSAMPSSVVSNRQPGADPFTVTLREPSSFLKGEGYRCNQTGEISTAIFDALVPFVETQLLKRGERLGSVTMFLPSRARRSARPADIPHRPKGTVAVLIEARRNTGAILVERDSALSMYCVRAVRRHGRTQLEIDQDGYLDYPDP